MKKLPLIFAYPSLFDRLDVININEVFLSKIPDLTHINIPKSRRNRLEAV